MKLIFNKFFLTGKHEKESFQCNKCKKIFLGKRLLRMHICNIDEPAAIEIVYKKTNHAEKMEQLLAAHKPSVSGTLSKSADLNETGIENACCDLLQSNSENGANAGGCLLHSSADKAAEIPNASVDDNVIEEKLEKTGIFFNLPIKNRFL